MRSTWFDSDDHDLFRSQRRRRVRLREYAGAAEADGIPSLTGACARRGPDRPLEPALARAAAQVRIGRLRPRLTTIVRRLSLTVDSLRVTLDDGLGFARPVRLGRAGDPAEPLDLVGRGPQLILAVKLGEPPPAWLRAATADFLLMTRFSTFRDGMLAIARADALGGNVAARPRDSILSPP